MWTDGMTVFSRAFLDFHDYHVFCYIPSIDRKIRASLVQTHIIVTTREQDITRKGTFGHFSILNLS